MIKAIMFYLRKNCDASNIREFLNETYGTDLTTAEVREAIENIQLTYSKKSAFKRRNK